MKKTLTHIVLGAAAVSVGVLGAALAFKNLSYNDCKQEVYQLEGERITLYSSPSKSLNILTVMRADGTKIEYLDNVGYDLKLECLKIYRFNENNSHAYCNDSFGHKVIVEGQKQFDDYLARIQENGLKDIAHPEKPKA